MFDKLILLTRFAPFVRDTYNQRQLQKLGIEYQKPTPVPPTIARGKPDLQNFLLTKVLPTSKMISLKGHMTSKGSSGTECKFH